MYSNLIGGVQFIEMCLRNSERRHSPAVGSAAVLVFDIDYCLYNSKEMSAFEANQILRRFSEMSKMDEFECTSLIKFSGRSIVELFYEHLNVEPVVSHKLCEVDDLSAFLSPDLELRELLEQCNVRKFCFTNGSISRASKILKHLQLDHCFEAVICADVQGTDFIFKPKPSAFEFLKDYVGADGPENIYFFDDHKPNVDSAEDLGWNGIHAPSDLKGHIIRTLLHLEEKRSKSLKSALRA